MYYFMYHRVCVCMYIILQPSSKKKTCTTIRVCIEYMYDVNTKNIQIQALKHNYIFEFF